MTGDNGSPGRLLIMGGAEDRCCGAGLLERFVELCGGDQARIVLITTASHAPEEVLAEYERVLHKLGVEHTSELKLHGRGEADSDDIADLVGDATGIFFTGGDQSKLRTLVGSRVNDIISDHLAKGLVVAGTSAGAMAMGRTMILGGNGTDVSASAVRTGPGLGLIPQTLIDTHFLERGRLPRLLSAIAMAPEHLGIGLDENTGVQVAHDGFEVIGSGVATVVDAEDATVVHPAGDYDPITLFGVRLHLLPHGCWFDFRNRAPSLKPAHDRY